MGYFKEWKSHDCCEEVAEKTMVIMIKGLCSKILLSSPALPRPVCWWGCLWVPLGSVLGCRTHWWNTECVYKHSISRFLWNRPQRDCPTPADMSDFSLAVLVWDLYTDKAGLCHSLKDMGMRPFKYGIWQQFSINVLIGDRWLSFYIC